MEWLAFIGAGSLFFWALAIAFFVIMVAVVEHEQAGTALTILVAGLLVAQFLVSGLNPFGWVVANFGTFLLYAAAYFVAGAAWTAGKWFFFLLRQRDIAKEVKAKFMQEKGLTGDKVPDTHRDDFMSSLRMSNYKGRAFPPNPNEHKARIVMWAAYWPVSAFWTLLNDPITRAWNSLYVFIGSGLQTMSQRMFKDFD